MSDGEKYFAWFMFSLLFLAAFIAGLAIYQYNQFHNELAKKGIVQVWKPQTWEYVNINELKEQK